MLIVNEDKYIFSNKWNRLIENYKSGWWKISHEQFSSLKRKESSIVKQPETTTIKKS